MPIQTTYANARVNFAQLCNEVTANQDFVIIQRRGYEDAALLAASELASLTETAHLLRSPKNAGRLQTALRRANARRIKTQTMEKLRRELGLERKKQNNS